MDRKTNVKLLLAAIISHVFWGFSFLCTKAALGVADMYVLLSHRFLIAFAIMNALLLMGVVKVRFKGKGRRILLPLLMGLMEPVVYFIGEEYGVIHSTTIFSGVMIAVIPIVSTFAAMPFLHETPTVGQVLFSLLSVGGVIGIGLMNEDSGALDWIGVAALLVAVAGATAYTLLSRHIAGRTSPFARTYAMMGVGAVFFTVLAMVRCEGSLAAYVQPLGETPYLLSVLFLSLFCSVISFFLSGYAITRLPVARETVFSNLTTAVAVFAGVVFLHEPFSWLSLVCILLILVGIYGVQRTAKERE